jgi:hypothetical protein
MKPLCALISLCVLGVLCTSFASATPATYRDLVRARLAGATNIPARIAAEPSRHVLSTDATSAVVRVISPAGICTTNTVRLALMPGAVRVQADQTAARAEAAAITRLALALAARSGAPTNDLAGPSASASERRAALYTAAATDAAKSDTLPLTGAAAAGAAAAAAAAALLRRKESTGVTTPVDPAPGGAGTPTS